MRILLVEDDVNLLQQLTERLRKAGYAVDAANNGRDGCFFGVEYPIDLAIIDLGLPEISGIEIIQTLRSSGKTYPVLILTARSRWQEKVEGLDAGADDYVTKPFYFEELQARISALIRRSAGHASPVIESGFIKLDTRSQDVYVHERRLNLTAFEYKLLHYMISHSGKVLSKMELTDHLYDEDADKYSNVIEVFVGRLRKKIDPNNEYYPIETLRGRGYRFMRRETPVDSEIESF